MKSMRIAVLLAALLQATAFGQGPPADLMMIPADAYGFAHLRIADVWKHDVMKSAREMVTAAGPKAFAAWEKQVYPSLGDLDRATVILVPGKNPQGPPDMVVLVRFKNAIDGGKLAKLWLPEAKSTTLAGKNCYVDVDKDIGLCMLDSNLVLAGPAKSVEAFTAKAPGKGDGPLSVGIAAAMTKTFTVAVNVKALPIPPQAYEQLPPDLRPLAMAEKVLFTVDLGTADPVLELNAMYAGEAAAMDAEKALKTAIMMGKQAMKQPKAEMEQKLYEGEAKGPQSLEKMSEVTMALAAIGGINHAEAMLDKLPISRNGSAMTAKVTIPKEATGLMGVGAPVALGLLLPAVQKVRMAAGTSQSQNNMKMIGLSMHNFESAYGKLPSAAICDKAGKPLLSWRVHILPYIEQDALYKQFKLDEPWDSPNNKPLIAKMPKAYSDPRVPLKEGETIYKVFTGKEALFETNSGRKFSQVTDGLSNTIMAVEGGEPVIWTKPDDIVFDSTKDLPKLELPGGLKDINVLMADGSVRRINLDKVSAATLKIAIGINDGMVLPGDWYGENATPRAFQAAPAKSPPVTRESAVPSPVKK
ncbi:hypothetical protein BH11PLA2_BH11PLA2_43020 [soil metagenome]